MLLMLKDVPVLESNANDAVFQVYREDLLPYYLKDRLAAVPCDAQKNHKTYLRAVQKNIIYVQDFLCQRVLPFSRANAPQIYALYNAGSKDRLRIALMCRAVSLLDNYWVKLCKETITWKDVSIREHPLNPVFTQAALRGSFVSASGSLISPETTTNGTYAKGWKREDGELYLYKKGQEAKIEVMVSGLLDHFNIPHVAYTNAADDGEICCKCKCITSDQVSIVDISTAEAWFHRKGESLVPFLMKYYADDLYKMWIADYLTANSDRHGQNWGFFYYADTTELIGLHWLFDHNNAFDPAYMNNPDAPYIAASGLTMRQAAHYAVKRAAVTYAGPILKSEFLTERQYVCFTSRLKELGIKQAHTHTV